MRGPEVSKARTKDVTPFIIDVQKKRQREGKALYTDEYHDMLSAAVKELAEAQYSVEEQRGDFEGNDRRDVIQPNSSKIPPRLLLGDRDRFLNVQL